MSKLPANANHAVEEESRDALELLPLAYSQLRRIAQRKMENLASGQTLQATALVHEAYLKLGQAEGRRFPSRRAFLAYASEAMRRILIDQVRRKQSAKRGGGNAAEELLESRIEAPRPEPELVLVHEALDALMHADPEAAELVKLRYFAGLTMPEVAETMGISLRSAERLWSYSRARLKRDINAISE